MIALPVETDDEHRPSVAVAGRLVGCQHGRVSPLRRDVTDALAEAAVTKLVGAAEKLNRIVDAERSQQKLHGSIMLVAQRQDVGPHGGILASPAKQNRRPKLPV